MYEKLRRLILKLSYPFNVVMGMIHTPRKTFRVTSAEYQHFRQHVKPGMVLVSYIEGHMTNLFISGPVKHAAIVRDDEIIVEAVGRGVTIDTLENFCTTKDLVVALKPADLNEAEMLEAANYAFEIAKRPASYRRYDYFFDSGDGAFYCAELIVYAWNRVLARLGRKPQFVNRKILGAVTTLPVDFLNATRKNKTDIVVAVGDVYRIAEYCPDFHAVRPSVLAPIGAPLTDSRSELGVSS
jgi:hypothetical protein